MTDFCSARVCVGCSAHLCSPAELHLVAQGSRALPCSPCLGSNLWPQREGEAAARLRASITAELGVSAVRAPRLLPCSGCWWCRMVPALPTAPAQRHGYPLAPGCCTHNVCGPLPSFLEGLLGNDPKKKGDNKRQLLGGKSVLNSASVLVRLPLSDCFVSVYSLI